MRVLPVAMWAVGFGLVIWPGYRHVNLAMGNPPARDGFSWTVFGAVLMICGTIVAVSRRPAVRTGRRRGRR